LHDNWISLAGTDQISTLSLDSVVLQSDPYSDGISGNDNFLTFTNNCVFHSGFTLPVDIDLESRTHFSGLLNLNDHILTLYSDLHFDGDGLLVSSDGSIAVDGDSYKRSLNFESDQNYESTLNINGDLTIECSGHELDLNLLGKFVIAAGKTLTLADMTVKNAPNDWITFSDSNLH